MKLRNGYRAAMAAAAMMLIAGTAAQAAEKLTLYCSPQIE